MSVSNTLEWLRKSAELTQGSESHAFMLAYECLNNALTTVEEDKKYIVRIERELHAAQTRIARLTGVNTPMEVTDSDTQHRRRKAGPWVEVTRQNDHGSIELLAPTQDGDTP